MQKLIAIIMVALSFGANSSTQHLDESFGSNGISPLISPYGRTSIKDTVELNNGKILFVGRFDNEWYGWNKSGYLIGSLNANGTIDKSFGNQGFVELNRFTGEHGSGNDFRAIKAFPASDGGFYLVGIHPERDANQELVNTILVSKHLINGQLDISYGEQGVSHVSQLNSHTFYYEVKAFIDAQERITVTGYMGYNEEGRYAISRVLSNGAVDTDFGTNGLIELPIYVYYEKENGDSVRMRTSDFHIAANENRFVAVATAKGNNGDFYPDYDEASQFLMYVFDMDGQEINRAFVDDRNKTRYTSRVILDENGHVNLGNSFDVVHGKREIGILKFDLNGEFVNSFGVDGLASYEILAPAPQEHFTSNHLLDFVRHSNGTYQLVANKNQEDFLFTIELSAAGQMIGEAVDIDIRNVSLVEGRARLSVLNDGSTIIAGVLRDASVFIKLALDRDYDETFSALGRAFLENFFEIRDAEKLNDGSLLVAGYGLKHEDTYEILPFAMISKITPAGKIVSAFGTYGQARIPNDGEYGFPYKTETYFDVEIDSDENIYAIGIVRPEIDPQNDTLMSIFATRHTSDGRIDLSFADAGMFVFDPGSIEGENFTYSSGNEIEVLADGSMILAGYVSGPEKARSLILKLTPSGQIDLEFGDQGKILFEIENHGDNGLFDLIPVEDNQFIATGFIDTETSRDVLTIKFNLEGQIDQSFGDSGVSIIGTDNQREVAFSVTSIDSQYYFAGYQREASPSSTQTAYVASLTADGRLNSTFANQGSRLIDWGTHEFHRTNSALSISSDPQGNLLVSGYADFYDYNGKSDLAIAALRTDGSLINKFGVNGIMNYHFDNSKGWKLIPDSESSMYVVGKGYSSGLVTKLSGYDLSVQSDDTGSGGNNNNVTPDIIFRGRCYWRIVFLLHDDANRFSRPC